MFKKGLKIALKSLGVLTALALVAGIIYEQIGESATECGFRKSAGPWTLVAAASISFVREQVRLPSSSSLADPDPVSNGSNLKRRFPSSRRLAGTTEPARVGVIQALSLEPAWRLAKIFMSY